MLYEPACLLTDSWHFGKDLFMQVTRAGRSWNYIYIALGFTLTIEGNAISMFNVCSWGKLAIYAAASVGTGWLFLESGRFQNWLIGIQGKIENKARDPHEL